MNTSDTPKKKGDAATRQGKWQKVFLKTLQEYGHVTYACSRAGVGRKQAYRERETKPRFAIAWTEALNVYIEKCEREVDRRAFEGVDKYVYFKGNRVDEIKEYSDTLAMFRLNGLKPERYRQRHEVSGPGGGPIEHKMAPHTLSANELVGIAEEVKKLGLTDASNSKDS